MRKDLQFTKEKPPLRALLSILFATGCPHPHPLPDLSSTISPLINTMVQVWTQVKAFYISHPLCTIAVKHTSTASPSVFVRDAHSQSLRPSGIRRIREPSNLAIRVDGQRRSTSN
ncbi:hypothetical protein N431DRAFT_113435 [Stipitochalara longipes BDJ]|nr:hypothetical protein N431DRAFT_113435 [Stipitochalara longipes BDJ]